METTTASDTISVELTGPRECTDLLEFLDVRGLTASLRETNDRCELEIGLAPSHDVLLRTVVHQALTAWLAERESPLVLAEKGDGTYLLRPASD